ncbi:MAG: carboxypeptidase-like regulatory domain-containing protein [Ignavibacteriaceae bacterium]|jgi:hypothetical protein
MRTVYGIILLCCLLLVSCKEESSIESVKNEKQIKGYVSLSAKGIMQVDKISGVVVSIGDKSTTTDSAGYWSVKGNFSDTVTVVIKKSGYGTYIRNDAQVKYNVTATLYSLPNYSITKLSVIPVQKNGNAPPYLTIAIEASSPAVYPDLRYVVLFFNTDSLVSYKPEEYLFAAEMTSPGQDNNYWISSSENKNTYNIHWNQSMYVVAYPITSWGFVVDKKTGRKQYFNVGEGKSEIVKFLMP